MDANALMMPVEVGVRLFEELDRTLGSYDAVVPDCVVAELSKLAERGGEEGKPRAWGRTWRPAVTPWRPRNRTPTTRSTDSPRGATWTQSSRTTAP